MNAIRRPRPHRSGPAHREAGFTLLEIGVILAIIGILLAIGVPSYANLMQRKQLQATAEALVQDLRHAREASVNGQARVYLSYRAGKRWCWGVSRDTPCDCSGASPLPACNISRTDNSDYPDVVMTTAQDVQFEPGLGQVSLHGAADFGTGKGHSLRVVLNALGRTQVCGRDAPGSPAC